MDRSRLYLFFSSAQWLPSVIAFWSIFMLTSCSNKELSNLIHQVEQWDCPLPANSQNLPSLRDFDAPETLKDGTLYELRQAVKGRPMFGKPATEYVDSNKKKYDSACERRNRKAVAILQTRSAL